MNARFRRGCLAAAQAATLAAFALSYQSTAAWALVALPAAALFLTLPAVPPRLAAALLWLSRMLIGVAAVAATGLEIAYGVGLALAALAGFFLLASRSFSAGAAVLPASLAVLLLAAGTPFPRYLAPAVWIAAAALALWLVAASAAAWRPRRIVALLLFVVPAAAIAEGILRFLPWAQPHVESVAFRYMTPSQAETGLGLGSGLGSIEQLAVSRQVLLRVWSDRPLSLRAAVHTQFNGYAWRPGPTAAPLPFLPANGMVAGADWERRVPGRWFVAPGADPAATGEDVRIVVDAPLRDLLPAPASVQAVRMSEPGLRLDAFGIVRPPLRIPAVYGIRHTGRPAATTDGDAALAFADCLQEPPGLDPRIRALAQELGPRDSSPAEKVARTVSHLQSHYRYALKVGKWKTRDPLSEFLFDKKKGYCEYFATAAVVLLRLQGVPARYVSGLSVRAANRSGDHFVVRASDAHAWAEALVPGAGWVEVDATPAAQYAEVHAELAPSGLEAWMEAVRGRWADLMAQVREGGWAALWPGLPAGLKLAAAGIAVAFVIRALARRRWRRRATVIATGAPPGAGVDTALRACFDRLETSWSSAGFPRPRYRAPLEHARGLPDEHEALRAVGTKIVEAYYRGAFGGETVTSEEIAHLRDDLARVAALTAPPSTSRRTRPGATWRP